jgi:hypothetical protein
MEEKLRSFLKDLNIIENSLIESIATNKRITKKKYMKALGRFHKNLITCKAQVQIFKTSTLRDELNSSLSTGIENQISTIAKDLKISLRQEEKDESISMGEKSLFEGCAQSILKLKSVVKLLLEETIELDKEKQSFQPQHINIEEVIKYADKAIEALTENTKIEEHTKTLLIENMKEVKQELKKKTPAWKKIIGGLMITAAIVSGIADADDALDNIKKAYTAIMNKPFVTTIKKDIIYQVDPVLLPSKVDGDTSTV